MKYDLLSNRWIAMVSIMGGTTGVTAVVAVS